MAAQQLGDGAARLGQPDEQVLGGDVLVAHLRGELLGGVTAASASRESCGALTVEPDAEGSRFDSCVSSPRTAAASAPTAASSGAAMPSPWASSAPSRWVGPTSGLPASAAAWTAAEIACWAFVVGLKESIPHVLLLESLGCPRSNVRKVECVPLKLNEIFAR